MAISIVSLGGVAPQERDPLLATRHLARTFCLANQRLSRADAVSDASIAVVVMMAQYERHRERYFKGLVHIEGLHRMAEMRGGLSSVARENPSLAQKIIKLDLDYALYLGTGSRFSIPEIESSCRTWCRLSTILGKEDEPMPFASDDTIKLPAELRDLAAEMIHLSRLADDAQAGRRPALNARRFYGTLLRLGHRLVHYSPLGGPRPVCPLENAVQLGLLAFMMPFMHRLDGKLPHSPLLSKLVRSVVEEVLDADNGKQEVLLWIMLVAGASLFTPQKDAWLVSIVTRSMEDLGLRTREDVGRSMSRYPWIHAFHDKAIQAFCTPG